MTAYKTANECDSDLEACCTDFGVCESDLYHCCRYTDEEAND